MRDEVREYYGQVLHQSSDLKTNACCTEGDLPTDLKEMLGKVHEEVLARYYGCGLIAPEQLQGCTVLDLGCGAGRDAYVLAQLVGEQGQVIGVDMTAEQLAVARRHLDFHRERFAYAHSNVRFVEGFIEELDQLDLEPGSVDVIVSNCVLNLSPDKQSVLRQAHALLRPGGEMYFADVYADRRLPEELRNNRVLYGECLGGALYWNDFLQLAKSAGFADPRLVEDRPIRVEEGEMASRLQGYRFYSATYRLFKLEGLEPACEDYGQAVVYKGDIPGHPSSFVLDKHHRIDTGRMFRVCGNSYRMLAETRFAPHFEFHGSFERHFGIFAGCGVAIPFEQEAAETSGYC